MTTYLDSLSENVDIYKSHQYLYDEAKSLVELGKIVAVNWKKFNQVEPNK